MAACDIAAVALELDLGRVNQSRWTNKSRGSSSYPLQIRKFWQRVKCSRRPDSFAAGKKKIDCMLMFSRQEDVRLNVVSCDPVGFYKTKRITCCPKLCLRISFGRSPMLSPILWIFESRPREGAHWWGRFPRRHSECYATGRSLSSSPSHRDWCSIDHYKIELHTFPLITSTSGLGKNWR